MKEIESNPMKSFVIILAVLFLALQYKLWGEKSGVAEVYQLKNTISFKTKQNAELAQENKAIMAEITDLKSGQTAVEERARNDLGMIKPGEVFYQIAPKSNSSSNK